MCLSNMIFICSNIFVIGFRFGSHIWEEMVEVKRIIRKKVQIFSSFLRAVNYHHPQHHITYCNILRLLSEYSIIIKNKDYRNH